MCVLWRVINLISFSVQQLEQMVAPAPAGAPSCLPRPALTYRHFCRGCLRLFIVFAHLLHIRYLTGVGLHWSISWLFGEGMRFGFFWTLAFLQKHFKNKGKLTEFVLQHFTTSSPEINLNCLTVCSLDERAGTCLKWWVALQVQVQHCQCRALAGVTQPCGSSCASAAARGFLTLLLVLAKMPE